MKNLALIGGLLLLVVATVLLTQQFAEPSVAAPAKNKDDKSRILESGVMRCGYVSNPPSCIVDPNTGQLGGIFVDSIEAIGEELGIRIEWTEEVGFGSMIEGLVTGRYDAVPCAIWPTAARSKRVDFSTPLFYSGVGAFVRADDNRFDENLDLINAASISVATMDGEMADAIARNDFPKANRIAVPQLSEISSMLLNVAEGKADVTFVELYFAHEFLQSNPGSLKNVAGSAPIRVFPNTIMLRSGESELKAMLNVASEELLNLGTVERLLTKYEPARGMFYRVQQPFRLAD